jgi:hypothetical protein
MTSISESTNTMDYKSPPAVCKYFNRSGGCTSGDKCPFIHQPVAAENSWGTGTAAPSTSAGSYTQDYYDAPSSYAVPSTSGTGSASALQGPIRCEQCGEYTSRPANQRLCNKCYNPSVKERSPPRRRHSPSPVRVAYDRQDNSRDRRVEVDRRRDGRRDNRGYDDQRHVDEYRRDRRVDDDQRHVDEYRRDHRAEYDNRRPPDARDRRRRSSYSPSRRRRDYSNERRDDRRRSRSRSRSRSRDRGQGRRDQYDRRPARKQWPKSTVVCKSTGCQTNPRLGYEYCYAHGRDERDVQRQQRHEKQEPREVRQVNEIE